MSGFLDQLERDLVDAARRGAAVAVPRRRPLRPRRSLLLAALAFALVGAATASAALLVLRGSAIPGPSPHDAPADQLPVLRSVRVSTLRAADPDPRQPAWTLRTARSRTGLVCSTVGQVADGRFGLVGMDGRFRALSPRIVDSCGAPRHDAASLIGARVLDARRAPDVRTVVNGIAGDDLRKVVVTTRTGTHTLPIAAGGAFLDVLRGYPEAVGVRVALTFADGRVERHDFGTSPDVVPDPSGQESWRTEAFSIDGDRRTCVSFHLTRPGATPASSPAACGLMADRHRRGYFFAVRRLEPGTGGPPHRLDGDGDWGRHEARTAVWGLVGDDVERAEVLGPGGLRVRAAIAPSRALLVVLAPAVDPAELTVRITFDDGHAEERHGDANLVDRKVPRP